MQTVEQASQGAASRQPALSSAALLWQFRALPEDEQRTTIRRLALCGLSPAEIAERTGWSLDRIRSVTAELGSPTGATLGMELTPGRANR